MSAVRVMIADDHGIVLKGIRFIIDQQPDLVIVGETGNGREAVQMAAELKPDVVVIDVAMPELNGIEATNQIVRQEPETGVIILSMHSDEIYLVRAIHAGARGYLLKDHAESELIGAVRTVSQKKPFFSPAIAKTLLEGYVRQLQDKGLHDSYELLTQREREIIQLLAEGKSNKEVAAMLDLSVYTVETHRVNLMQKLGLHNTAEIVLYAVRKKIVH